MARKKSTMEFQWFGQFETWFNTSTVEPCIYDYPLVPAILVVNWQVVLKRDPYINVEGCVLVHYIAVTIDWQSPKQRV